MSKSGCDFALGELTSECGTSLAKGVVKAYFINRADATVAFGPTGTDYNVITSITLATGAKAVLVNDYRTERFADTAKGSASGVYGGEFSKTFSFNFRNVSILGAQDVDALAKNPDGWIVILQRDKSLGSAAFEVFGAMSPMRVADNGVAANYGVNDDTQNSPIITFNCTEDYYGVFFNCAAGTATEAEAYAANLAAVTALLTAAE